MIIKYDHYAQGTNSNFLYSEYNYQSYGTIYFNKLRYDIII